MELERISRQISAAYRDGDDAALGAALREFINATLRSRGIEPPSGRKYLAVSRTAPPTGEMWRR